MKYIGFFDLESNKNENRINHMSSHNKMMYIAKTLEDIEEEVMIVSPSWTLDRNFYKGSRTVVTNKLQLKTGPTLPNLFGINKIFSLFWLTLFLLLNTQKKETIIVYHSLALIYPIKIIKKIKKIRVILEVEEIYSSVIDSKKKHSALERKYITEMDQRILVSEKLRKIVGNENDIVLYGDYEYKKNEAIPNKAYNFVYAGTIDKLKGGAFNSIELIRHVKNKAVRLYILGEGENNVIEDLNKIISDVNANKGYELIKFLGKKSGKEFNDIMSGMGVGMNIQNQGEYMETAFPSKILSYMSFNLAVVSSKVDSIYHSSFTDYITFVDSKNEKDWAKKFDSWMPHIFANKNQSKELLKGFDLRFKQDLYKALKGEKNGSIN